MSMCLANAELLQTVYKRIHSCMCHCRPVSGANNSIDRCMLYVVRTTAAGIIIKTINLSISNSVASCMANSSNVYMDSVTLRVVI